MTDPAPRISEDELDLDPTQALGVALSVQAGSMLMWEAQDRAPAMLAHLQAMGYDVVPVAAARSAPAAGLDVELERLRRIEAAASASMVAWDGLRTGASRVKAWAESDELIYQSPVQSALRAALAAEEVR